MTLSNVSKSLVLAGTFGVVKGFNFTKTLKDSCEPAWDKSLSPFTKNCYSIVTQIASNISGNSDFWSDGGLRDQIDEQCGVYARSSTDNFYKSAVAISARILNFVGLANFDEENRTIDVYGDPICGRVVNGTTPTIILPTTTSSESFSISSAVTTASPSAVSFFSTDAGIVTIVVIAVFVLLLIFLASKFCNRKSKVAQDHYRLDSSANSMNSRNSLMRPLPNPPVPTADEVAIAMLRIQSVPRGDSIYSDIQEELDDGYEKPVRVLVPEEKDHEYEYYPPSDRMESNL